jgi:hypothetical protein
MNFSLKTDRLKRLRKNSVRGKDALPQHLKPHLFAVLTYGLK